MTATLTTLVSFNGTNGFFPSGSLLSDAKGDLFGTTALGGADGLGTVFEVAKTAHGYSSIPTTLVSFNGTNGSAPASSLIADAKGNLFGTTRGGGADDQGTVFEIAETPHGYASSPTTLLSFNGTNGANPQGSLIADAKGNLFGTTRGGGADDQGTVFEIAKTPHGYAGSPTTLVSFNGTNGSLPEGSLIADAKGDLFGTTLGGGAGGGSAGLGTVFEIAKTPHGYASSPTTLVSFNGTNGASPQGSLIADAKGDLFGTTASGGAFGPFGLGTVFEIAKLAHGYATSPSTLVSFNGTDGSFPAGSLIADAKGDLFGTTLGGIANVRGTVFEVAKTAQGYASTPTILASFNGTNGSSPVASLIADAKGNLFGTTSGGGADGKGTVFEITGSEFAVHHHSDFLGDPSNHHRRGDATSHSAAHIGHREPAAPSVALSELLAGETANISMADLVPAVFARSSNSAAHASPFAPVDEMIGTQFAAFADLRTAEAQPRGQLAVAHEG